MTPAEVLAQAHGALEATLDQRVSAGSLGVLLELETAPETLDAWGRALRAVLGRGSLGLTDSWWSGRALPLLHLATEVGYTYEGSGHAYWEALEDALGSPLSEEDRDALAARFEALSERSGIRPGETRWDQHFCRIAWPITHAVLPRMLHASFAETVERSARLHGPPARGLTVGELGQRLRRAASHLVPPLLLAILEREELAGELAAGLLWEDHAPELVPAGLLRRIRAELLSRQGAREAVLRARRAKRASSPGHGSSVELLLDWQRQVLFVDLRGSLAAHREELARSWDRLRALGGLWPLAQLAHQPQPVAAELTELDRRPVLDGDPPPGLSGSLSKALGALHLEVETPLAFGMPDDDAGLAERLAHPRGRHRLLVRPGDAVPPGGEARSAVAGLACFEYESGPSTGAGVEPGPSPVLLGPPDLRGRDRTSDRHQLAGDALVCSLRSTGSAWRVAAEAGWVELPPQGAPRVAVRVARRPPPWTALRVRLTRATTRALRASTAALQVSGTQGAGVVPLVVELSVAGGARLARLGTHLHHLPCQLDGAHPLMRRLSRAAHGADARRDLLLRATVGGGPSVELTVAGATRTSRRTETGSLAVEVGGAHQDVWSLAASPLEALEARPEGPRLRFLQTEGGPLLGSGELAGQASFSKGGVVAQDAPRLLARTLEGWGGGLGVLGLAQRYLAWATAEPADSAERPLFLTALQGEVVAWLEHLLVRALCGERWWRLEQDARARMAVRWPSRAARWLVHELREADDPALAALHAASWSEERLVQTLAPVFELMRAEVVAAPAEVADDLTDELNRALDDALREAGRYEDGVVDADLYLEGDTVRELLASTDLTRHQGPLLALLRPARLRALLAQPRAWGWLELDQALDLLAGHRIDTPTARQALLLWLEPDLLVLDEPGLLRETLQRLADDQGLARALRWLALRLRGELDAAA